MKYFYQHLLFSLFCILYILDTIFCTKNVYEEISPYVQNSEIIDPHSLYYNRQTQTIKIPKNDKDVDIDNNQMILKNVDSHQFHCKDSHYEVFARRLINMLILKSNFKIREGIAFGQLDLEATIEELEIIKSFGEGKISIRQIDGIISNVIRPIETSLFDEVFSHTDILIMYFYQNRIIFGTIFLSAFIIIISLKVKWTRFRVIILIFDIMFVISYLMTWWDLVQESAIKLAAQQKIYSEKPNVCQQSDINFFSSVTFLFGQYTGFDKDDCIQYFDTVMSDPVLKVTPLHALNHMCSKLLFHPLSVAAYYLSDFIENYTGSSSLIWPFSYLVKISLYLYMPIVIGLLIFLFFGGSMGFRVGPFIHLYIHSKQSPPSSIPLDRNDRQAIEVINSDTSKNDITFPVKAEKEKAKHIKTLTNFDDITQENSHKPVEIDYVSDEFPEEKEYEKICRERLEKEMNISSNDKIIEKDYLEKEEKEKISE